MGQDLRVAAYCRVSTKHDEQLYSLKNQSEYYKEYIQKHPGWKLVGVFADRKSARSISNRPAFQKMLKLCRQHKIDLILTKSIQRFSRNTLDLLSVCRKLHDLGIEIFFETEQIRNTGPETELLLSVFGALAQNTSENLSKDIRWGLHRGFERGNSPLYSRPCYGYRKGPDGKLQIYPPEAAVVKQIFQWRKSGLSLAKISAKLAALDIPAPNGGNHWGPETLNKVLHNEKYTGNVLLGKTFVPDYLKGGQKRNIGQATRYYAEHTHDPIIGTEDFESVAGEILAKKQKV